MIHLSEMHRFFVRYHEEAISLGTETRMMRTLITNEGTDEVAFTNVNRVPEHEREYANSLLDNLKREEKGLLATLHKEIHKLEHEK